jgi:hypothetical protein
MLSDIPRSTDIGSTNNPNVWRIPIAALRMTAPATMTAVVWPREDMVGNSSPSLWRAAAWAAKEKHLMTGERSSSERVFAP